MSRVAPTRRRSQAGLVLAGAVVIAAGFAVGLVEMYRLPKGSIWIVVGGAIALIALIRLVTAGRW
jgi:hypothetical protein